MTEHIWIDQMALNKLRDKVMEITKTTRLRLFTILVLLISQAACLNSNASDMRRTAQLYKSFIQATPVNTAQLNLFFSQMPKGGDLHHHYSGSIYAETYLEWVKQKGYWINKKTLKVDTKKTANSITVDELNADAMLFRKLLGLWSDLDFYNHFHLQPPPDLNFFNTFGYFGPVSGPPFDTGLQILKQRAIDENVQYIETMLKTVSYKLKNTTFDKKARKAVPEPDCDCEKAVFKTFDAFVKNNIKKDKNFNKAVTDYVTMVDALNKKLNTQPDFHMAFQTYATRSATPAVMFSKLYAGFSVANQSPHVVGVNIVGPENGHVALQDYTLHMYMFRYLKKKFPNVKTAMHAGELVLGLVRPKQLLFHINQAVNIAEANRIGHGIDIFHEQKPFELLKTMKQKNIAVEINLTSNEFILGVKDGMHPIHIYKKAGVPFVISTDDSGVSRNNLTKEYVLLAQRYKPDYKSIKRYVMNSIDYSFLDEARKNALKVQLKSKFSAFERKMALYARQRHQ